MGADENAQAMIYTEESGNILRKLNLKSFESEYKVMIIWLPEKMKAECSNKLLKILEEPYPNTLFLLIAEHGRDYQHDPLPHAANQYSAVDTTRYRGTTGTAKTTGSGIRRGGGTRGFRKLAESTPDVERN